ncbi:MAG: bifunctional metallophosphatase/5'-nucleotidase, partial [Sphingobacterium sp.]
LGYAYDDDQISDCKLAANIRNVDIILGGHTHTFLDKPTIVKDLDSKDVYINQVGFAGIRLGRLDVIFNKSQGSKKVIAQHYTIDRSFDQTVTT